MATLTTKSSPIRAETPVLDGVQITPKSLWGTPVHVAESARYDAFGEAQVAGANGVNLCRAVTSGTFGVVLPTLAMELTKIGSLGPVLTQETDSKACDAVNISNPVFAQGVLSPSFAVFD
jgi:hypothetical protein